MSKQMLIDATHPEETRVVVLDGARIEDFDYETTSKKQLKGNIYLAKVTRVEPSLQAAFVDYGGNRHGFLPFSEIHPDYYRIPIADREALIAERSSKKDKIDEGDVEEEETPENEASPAGETRSRGNGDGRDSETSVSSQKGVGEDVEEVDIAVNVDTVGGDEAEEAAFKRLDLIGNYKIQEVIKRRQILLVQVTKEERGNKGAALTTYLSLAGRYCVLMPNTPKGGGISRKITNPKDRRRLRSILADLKIPEGIGIIVRTAGAQRTKAEIRRDYEYLLRLWNDIREMTLQSAAPALIYEEASLLKRAMRDLYTRDMDDILIEGEEAHKAARSFMKSLMPSHARKVKLYKDADIPLLHRYGVESQLDSIHSNSVTLPSGGYIVLNSTEALVAIDVNSGKATRERHIEETALKTNLEAADEIGRQLRLRDLAGLIVIDFIDMDENRHNREVERRLKEALRLDRARIQLGRISPFGLLEMSRQRLRPSLTETSTQICTHCGGLGRNRTTESLGLHILRTLEEEGIRSGGGQAKLTIPSPLALYLLNQKRQRLVELEARYGLTVEIELDETLVAPSYQLERLGEATPLPKQQPAAEESEEEKTETPARKKDAEDTADEGERKRSRRRRGRRKKEESPAEAEEAVADSGETPPAPGVEAEAGDAGGEEAAKKRRRRGKRGGRRRSKKREEAPASADADADAPSFALEEEPEGTPAEVPTETPEEEPAYAAPAAMPLSTSRSEARVAPAEVPGEEKHEEKEEPAPAKPPAKRRTRSRAKPKEEAKPAAEAPEPEPEETHAEETHAEDTHAEDTHAEEESDEDDSSRPKRRGWWQRLIER